MNVEERKFLNAVFDAGGIANSFEVPSTNRAQDRARQSCRRKGLAYFDRDLWRWVLTDAGRAALAETE